MPCCDINGLTGLFRGPLVWLERFRFEQLGLSKRQQVMLELCSPHLQQATVLDIGCGTGALSLSMLHLGARHAALVEVSPAYLRQARSLAEKATLAARVRFYQGDALNLAALEPADIVVLDRVVCCYPDAEALLRFAVQKSRRLLVFSYPRPNRRTRAFQRVLNGAMRLLRKIYRLHLHSPERLERAAQTSGYVLREERDVGIWRLQLYA